VKGTHGTTSSGGEVSHMTQGASRGSRVNRAARPQQHHGGAVHCSSRFRFGSASCEMPAGRNSSPVTGKSASPGEDPTGAGAERELGFDPQSKAELAQGEGVQRSKGSTGTTRTHRRAAGWGGVARGGAKDPTDGPAELDVLF
jgi:hypothetical protein